MTWLVYVLNDMFSIVTGPYTHNYTWKCTAVVWLIAAYWSFAQPVHHRVRIDRQCNVDAVDFTVTCSSGTFEIGRLDHFVGFVGLVVVGCVVGYVWQRVVESKPKLRTSNKPSTDDPMQNDAALQSKRRIQASLFLHVTAQHTFERRHWAFEGVYFLDKASAVLTGILALHAGDKLHIMDVKTWRVYSFVYAKELNLPEHLRHAIPLAEAYDDLEHGARRSSSALTTCQKLTHKCHVDAAIN
ncbi:Aste57867_12764 [Aphanomyces stellatus]|uniref:Aste57867_12764 protein n=1 Tax=Aphanomyces stellatus TaxID=120398 RepID=A0A485KX33_9STRA|nr:hypothetical protein As57867_012716 [Aphanomyces stellatus]VFT89613.1 Aste57867_12764 [Aphanomyces stellatus]